MLCRSGGALYTDSMAGGDTTKSPRRILITARDQRVFFAVWSHRFLDTNHIQMLVDPSWHLTNLRRRLSAFRAPIRTSIVFLHHSNTRRGLLVYDTTRNPLYTVSASKTAYLDF